MNNRIIVMLLMLACALFPSFIQAAETESAASSAANSTILTFSDAEIETQVRTMLGKPNGNITESMAASITQLNVDGKKAKSLSDLSKMKGLRYLRISSFQNITPYLATIGDLPALYELSIRTTILPDLSFLRKLHLKRLFLVYDNITDISELAGQTGLTYLDISRNRITDHSPLSKLKKLANVVITCIRNEDLSFMKDFDSLAAFTIYGSYALKDFSFIKSIKNVKDISIYEVSPYADLSFLLQMADSRTVNTSLGSGKAALTLQISINESIRTILSKIIKPGMSDIEKELVIHDYVITNSDTGLGNKELWAYNNQQTMAKYGAYFTLMTGYFRDITTSFRILMNAAGVECMALSGSARGVSAQGVMVKIQGEYYLIDPNLDKDTCVGTSERILYNHFNLSAGAFRDNIHQWDEDFFPQCTSQTYSYLKLEERTIKVNPQKRAESRMVLVTGGSFKNTNSKFYGKKTAVADFWISNCEVTKKEWDDVMGTQTGGNDFPAAGVAWGDCIEYCNKRSIKEGLTPCYTIDGKTKNIMVNLKANGYRLPTNTEWEYAASGGSLSKSYLYSGSNNIGRVAVYKSPKTAVVGTLAPNELNIYDMSGNVWEWCWEADNYNGVPATSERPGSMSHAVRGGGWVSEAAFCTLTQKGTDFPFFNASVVGFRIARSK